jgi:multidrug efflux pump subunit AcrB
MQANADMRGVNDNWNESVKVMRLQVDQDKARALGVTSQSIAEATGMNFSGTTVGQYREGDKLIDIVMRPPKQDRDAITDIAGVYVTTARAVHSAHADCQARHGLGAGRDVARKAQLRDYRSRRCA